ncbi:MAG TPA: spermidine synthase [Polyangia bacterium]|nr:spermidine synthase [Polyangia bacterium]
MRRWPASLLLMVASGFGGLGYQIVWTQQCALWLGHEAAAVLAVISAFFGGLAAGAFTLGSRVARSARPVRWYAACEFTVAAWGLLLIPAMPRFSAWALRLTGVQPTPAWQWLVAFLGSFLLFLPATAAMGTTLPAMERITSLWPGGAHDRGRSIAALYASNTLGAVAGVLAAAFWLVPRLGLARTAAISVALNLVCGLISLVLLPASAQPAPDKVSPAVLVAAGNGNGNGNGACGLMARLALTGFLGIGYEVLVVRVLSQVTEDTVYTFALLLAVYLVGSAAGAAGYRRWLLARPDRLGLSDPLFGALAAACLVGTASLWAAADLKALALHALGGTVAAALAAEAVLALFAFGPASMVMGAVFSHLSAKASASGIGFGRALGLNTLGASAAPALWGVLAVRALGPKLALLMLCFGYLALTSRRAWSRSWVWAPASASLALAVLGPPLAFVDVPEGGRVVYYRDGVMGAVSVVEDASGVARLRINNRQQEGSSATFRFDARQAWLPLLLHPAPLRALFLGLGTGVTAGSATEDPRLHVDAVELLPEVIEAAAYFSEGSSAGRVLGASRDGPGPGAQVGPGASSRLQVMAADARRYVRATERRYDVIVSDNFHPARSGSGSLYTVEHFEAVRRRLDAGGLFCQWLPLHQLDLESLRSIVQSFLAIYPHAWAMLASNSLETPVLGLVAHGDSSRFDVAALHERLVAGLPARISGLGLEDELAVLGSFVAGPESLRRLAADAAANTDDHPVVAYGATRITYAPDSTPRDRLIAFLREVSIEPGQLIVPPSDLAWPRRLVAYWAARNRFVEVGRDVRPSQRVEDMLAQVRGPLLSVLRISPDFRPAYDPLLAMATALARSDAASARMLLSELTRLQPARPEAPRVLSLMGTDTGAPTAAAAPGSSGNRTMPSAFR